MPLEPLDITSFPLFSVTHKKIQSNQKGEDKLKCLCAKQFRGSSHKQQVDHKGPVTVSQRIIMVRVKIIFQHRLWLYIFAVFTNE